MANLNLSEFTEKLFVADADHTFIWDSAASISKRVSRNSWLNSGTLTSDAPVTISQTWNAGSNVMTALRLNVTDTVSGGTSSLFDARTTAGGSQFSVQKGVVVGDNYSSSTTYGVKTPFVSFGGYYGSGALCGSVNGLTLFATPTVNAYISIGAAIATIGNTNSALAIGAAADTILLRDSASGNTLALRNGTSAQTFNVYGTYSDASNYSRLRIQTLAGFCQLNAEGAGGGINSTLALNTSGTGYLSLRTSSTERFNITASGHFVAAADNSYDIGASGANRPRNVYVGSQLVVGTNATFGSFIYAENYYFSTTKGLLAAPSDGVFTFSNRAATDFTRLQFGGTTASFPAIKRSTVRIQAVLANDSGFTNIQGKLTTDTDYTATVVTPTGFLTLYDAQGTAYRVPCVLA